jgi:hypothetical protein
MGIIDDGIAFAHERFRAADGSTRVHYFWRMDGPIEAGSTVSVGREIWKADLGTRKGIDSLLRDATIGGLVDEEKVYREAAVIDFNQEDHKAAAWNRAHGTHVLDLAAGYRPDDAPPNVPIIAVQLPVAATADTSGTALCVHVKAAVDYILDRAARLSGTRPQFPVVINFSYGNFAGPHDGTSAVEMSMDNAISGRGTPLSLALPAGNGHLSRCHAEMAFSDRKNRYILNWRVQPDDLTSSQMEIWMPHEGPSRPAKSRVKIRIATPSGLLSPALEEVHGSSIRLVEKGQVLLEASYSFVPFPTERGLFSISMAPTALLEFPDSARTSRTMTAPAGVWKVHVANECLPDHQVVEAWIQRDDVVYGYRQRGRQSYFEANCYKRFHPRTGDDVQWDYEENAENAKQGFTVRPCHVKRRGMLNAIATGAQTTVVGGVYAKGLQLVEYSAGGPATPARGGPVSRLGPDAVAVSDDSRAHRGVIAAGSRSGSAVAMNGTSVATPQVARKIAELWAGRTHNGDRNALRAASTAEEAGNPNRPPMPPEIRGGRGRIIVDRSDRPPRVDP